MITTFSNEKISSTTDITEIQYLARVPIVKQEKKKAIILLHGVGSNEKDLFRLAQQFPNYFYIISPRGQFSSGPGRYAWYNVDFSTGKPIFNALQELSSREFIKNFVMEVKQKYNLDEIYIGGFSQGAIMSYSIGLTNPKEVNGIISLSGRILEEIRPIVTSNEDMKQLRVFVAHGIQDTVLPIHYAKDAKSFLENLQVELSYNEYQMGHQINEAVIKNLNTWLTKYR